MSIAICFSQKQLILLCKTCYQLKTCIRWIFTKNINREKLSADITAKSMTVPRDCFCHHGCVQESTVHSSIPGSDETSKQEQSSYSGHNMVVMPLVKLHTGQHSKLQHCSANKHLGRSSFTYRHVIDKNMFNIVSELG